jgi:hypothetical protein
VSFQALMTSVTTLTREKWLSVELRSILFPELLQSAEAISEGVQRDSAERSMNNARYLLAVVACFFVFSTRANCSASLVYLTPNGSATGNCQQNGTTAIPVFTPSQFNSSTNWGSGSSQIGPGTTILLCGTFVGSAGSTELAFQGNGTSGAPIVLVFDTNAQLNAPYWPPSPNGGGCGGAICMFNRSYIAIEGGTNGVVQNTANGDSLTYQQPSEGIEAMGCNNCTIKDLTIANIYVHTTDGNDSIDQTQMRCVTFNGSNWTIMNNTLHDTGWCLFENYNNGDGNVSIYKNRIYDIDHGWMIATNTAGGSSGPFNFYSNQVYGYSTWDTTNDAFHHDGIHCFTAASGSAAHITALNIYNNLFNGPVGGNFNSHIFLEGGTGSSSTPCADSTSQIYIYNNVILGDQASANGLVDPASSVVTIYNNTMIGASASNGVCFNIGNDINSVTFENNAVSTCNELMMLSPSTGSGYTLTANYNQYGNGGSNSFVCKGNFYNYLQFSSWQSCMGGDANSAYNASLNLNSTGVPQAGSPVGTSGANLAALGITALNYDTSAGNTRTPALRPSTWPSGAYNPSTLYPSSPSGLTATVTEP